MMNAHFLGSFYSVSMQACYLKIDTCYLTTEVSDVCKGTRSEGRTQANFADSQSDAGRRWPGNYAARFGKGGLAGYAGSQ